MCHHCWQPIQFFQLPSKLPTPMSLELQISVAFCKQKTFLFHATFANWFRFIFSRLKAWKLLHRYLDCHSILLIFWKELTFGLLLSGQSDFFSNYVHLYTLTLIAHFDFIWLISHWACKFICYIWFYKGHDWFWFYMIWSLLLWALDLSIL